MPKKIYLLFISSIKYIKRSFCFLSDILNAVEQRNLGNVQRLLREGDEIVNERYDDFFNSTLLQKAAKKGYYNILKELLISGADVNFQDKGGRTALIWASYCGYRSLVEELLNHEADVNKSDNFGCTALSFAASNGYTEIVKDLLDHNADVNIQNEEGNTALHIILKGQLTDAKTSVMKLLLSDTANIEQVNNLNKSVTQLAEESRNKAMMNLMKEFSEQRKINAARKALEKLVVNQIIDRRKNKLKKTSFLYDEVENLRQNVTKNECEKKQLEEKIYQINEKINTLKCTLKTKMDDEDFQSFEKLRKDVKCFERFVEEEKFHDVIQLTQRECSICFKEQLSNQNMYHCQMEHKVCEVCSLKIKEGNNICPLCQKNYVKTITQNRGLTFGKTQEDRNFLKAGYIFIVVIVTAFVLPIIFHILLGRK